MASSAALPRPAAYAPFQHGDFSLYQAARILLIIGGQMIIVALQWQVYDLTGSKFHLGMIGLAQFLPNLLFSLPAGHVADRRSRRAIVMACALACASTACLLAWQATRPAPSIAVIYVACGLFGFIRAFSAPAGHAFLPAIVPASILPNAIVWHLTVFQLATVVGPSVGGFV